MVGGKRKLPIAMYLELWHPDVLDVLELRKNHGKEQQRARDLFVYAPWAPGLFMRRVKENSDWTLFRPIESLGLDRGKALIDVWGEEFKHMNAE